MNKIAIYGGLGNQMFQYALAIAMDASGIPTKVSINDYFLNRHYQGFELLKAFNVPMPIQDKLKVFAIKQVRPLFVDINTNSFKNIMTNFLSDNGNIYKEKEECVYDEEVFLQKSSFLVGTWQSLKYFEAQSDLIREVFNFTKPKDLINIKIANDILNSKSVAVHVRRGNFMDPQIAKSKMVIDSSDYYYKSFEIIREKVSNPIFYIFSDDIKWAKEHFKGPDFVFVTNNKGTNSYLDMYLMSLCKHFIIANSSFSWWAAWLAGFESKKIIMPKPWIKGNNCSDIYPKDWIALDVNQLTEQIA
ncbi:alpha-1,2-fucosyltransferase [Algoriphagus sp.]|uniref:alpha-1,2-fucosyltransferase n=1 Tax=Algoriphagus sp. TaxID=1872435 RepID=UPI0025DF618A|nr:alpha-1,2-fucosyltransferase [Algoriphagus sp.]